MRMNFLLTLLCENLMKTYQFFREKKQMYFPILQNIQNIFKFNNITNLLIKIKKKKSY